jgi:Cyclic nucleotide-binding domain/FHA domain
VAGGRDLNDPQAFLVSGGPGDYLFRQGDDGSELFLLQQGQVELVSETGGSTERLIVLSAGDLCGERQLFEPGVRTVSARGVTPFQAFRIDRETLARLVSEDPNVALGMIERLATSPQPAAGPDVPSAREAEPPPPSRQVPPSGTPYLGVTGDDSVFELSESAELTVGRADRSSGYVPEIDLSSHDEERSLSRRHAKLRVSDGRVFVREEKKARNGTFVDGRRLQTGEEVELQEGATVRFGLVETVFGRRR